MNIVALLPSATEILCLLGLKDNLRAVTHECDRPAGLEHLPRATRTRIPKDASSREIDQIVREKLSDSPALYDLDMDVLHAAAPDLIVTQALCDVCAVPADDIEQAAKDLTTKPDIVNVEPSTVGEMLDAIETIGAAAGVRERAIEEVAKLRQRIKRVQDTTAQLSATARPRVAVLEWIDPLFNAGHWTPEIIKWAGGKEVLGAPGLPSRTIDWGRLFGADPEVLIIACCGFEVDRAAQDMTILEGSAGWPNLTAVKNGRVYIVNGQHYFSRPGPSLIDSLEIAAHILHPEYFDDPLPDAWRHWP